MNVQTARLILRPWRKEDFKPFAEMNADPRVRKYFPTLQTSEESNASAQFCADMIEEQGWGLWAVSVPGISDFIGFIGLQPAPSDAPFAPAIEIGWRLAHDYWGKGYATEGAIATLNFGFEELNLNEIVSFTATENWPSRRVMERIGMHRDPKDDFDHPKLPKEHWLCRHVLYRILNTDKRRKI